MNASPKISKGLIDLRKNKTFAGRIKPRNKSEIEKLIPIVLTFLGVISLLTVIFN